MLETSLSGKTIMIAGASRGIGWETASLLLQSGAKLVLGGRNTKSLQELSMKYGEDRVLALHLDVTEEESVKNFILSGQKRFGRIDGFINSAGAGTFQCLLELATEDFDRMISVNLRGTFLCCKYVGKIMAEQGFGKILNLISIAGSIALPGCAGYSASKFGVLGLTRVMQSELRSKGVQVTSVLPGAVSSSFWDAIEPKPDLQSMIPLDTIAKHLVYLLMQPDGAVIDEITIMPPLGIL